MVYFYKFAVYPHARCTSFSVTREWQTNEYHPCTSVFRDRDILCERDMRPVDTEKAGNQNEQNDYQAPIHLIPPQNRPPDGTLFRCPAGHLTHNFLICDEQASCWSKPSSYSTSEEWGIPSRASCPAPMRSLPAMFYCSSGSQRVPYSVVCDHRQQCADSSDESFCVFSPCFESNRLRCRGSTQCITTHKVCDGQGDCMKDTDERQCGLNILILFNDKPPPGVVHFTPLTSEWSVLPDSQTPFSVTPLPQRSNITANHSLCPETHFQCFANGFCLPVFVRCNGVNDCPAREDEAGCDTASCPGFYRCRSSGVCLHPRHLCDSTYQCPEQDDELFCNMSCPANCTCHARQFTCRKHFHAEVYPDIRYLDASESDFRLEHLNKSSFLIHLSVSRCGLKTFPKLTLPNLRSLDLSHNDIYKFNADRLRGMHNLQYMSLTRNPLVSLFSSHVKQFVLPTLKVLDVSGARIPILDLHRFSFLTGLHTLNLSHCGVNEVVGEGIHGIRNLEVLDVAGCPMTRFSRDLLSGLSHLRAVQSDNFKVCCRETLPSGFNLLNCRAPFNLISSCASLLRSDIYRVFLTVLSTLGLLGNLCCFLQKSFSLKRKGSGFGVFVANLSVSDFLMGVYLAVIGVADRLYRGIYLWEDISWRYSVACQVAGFLSLLSNEVSAFIICLITLDRFLVLRFPFSNVHFSARSAQLTCAVVWIIGTMLAVAPLTPMMSNRSFYSQTGICIPLPVTRSAFPGHQYAFAILIVFNFILFVFIALGQVAIYLSIQSNRLSTANSTKKSTDLTIARRLITVAVSDFLCWFPIGLLGLLASRGVPIPGEINVGMAILVLPLNSALNPFLYTINVLLERRKRSRDEQTIKQLISHISDEEPIMT